MSASVEPDSRTFRESSTVTRTALAVGWGVGEGVLIGITADTSEDPELLLSFSLSLSPPQAARVPVSTHPAKSRARPRLMTIPFILPLFSFPMPTEPFIAFPPSQHLFLI